MRIVGFMVEAETYAVARTNVFIDWMDRMEFTQTEAARALGKTIRMIGYYQQGHEVPVGTLYLMEAIEAGYVPPPLRLQKR